MTIDFNNIRTQAGIAYNRLVKKLNESIIENDGQIVIDDWEDIRADVDDLRNAIVATACVYEPDNDDFKSVIDDIGDMLLLGGSDAEKN